MKLLSTLLFLFAFCFVLNAQEVSFSPLPDSCFDLFIFPFPKSQSDAGVFKFTRQLDSLLATPNPDTLALAIVYRRLGLLYYDLSDYKTSQAYAYKSLQLLKNLTPVPEAEYAKSLQVRASTLFLTGQYDEVQLCLDTAIDINRRLFGAMSPMLCANLRAKGIAYGNMTRYQDALVVLNQAVLNESQIYRNPHHHFGKTIYSRGMAYLNLKEYEPALRDFKHAEQMILQTLGPMHPSLGNIYHMTGLAYTNVGDYDNALTYYRRSLAIREQTLGGQHPEVGYLYLNIGDYYIETGDLPKAILYKEQGLEILENADAVGIDKFPGMLLLYATVGNYEKEAKFFEGIFKSGKLGVWGITTEYAVFCFTNHAFSLLKQNRSEEALVWLDKALEITRQINPDRPRLTHGILLLKAEGLTRLSRYDEAISILENVLKTAPIFENQKQAQAGMAATLYEKFKAQGHTADLENAWQNDLAALLTLDSMRFSYQSSGSRIQQSELNFKLFEGALEICHERQDAANAFWVAEKSKAQALLDNHRDDIARRMAGLPDSLLRLESELKSQIADLEKTIYETAQNDERQASEAALFEKKQSLNNLLQTFETAYPAYFRLRYNTSLASAAEIQARLPEATALLEYFVGDSSIYVFTLTRDKLAMSALPKPIDFETTVQNLRSALTDSELRFLNQDNILFATASGKLHDWLLAAPLAALPPGVEHLIIVPDGALSYLPFEILGKNEGRSDFKAYPYLLKKFSVSYAASANLLLEQTRQGLPGRDMSNLWRFDTSDTLDLFAGFAPSYIDADTLNQAVSRVRALLVRDEKYNLPGAAREVQEIADLLGGKTWFGDAATKQAFKQQSARFQILHLAMHSVMDDANPLFSKLLFTQSPDAREDNDLNANELFDMQIPARLVVLSACNTGAGKLRRGEGVMSLSRAFSYAGVPATVMSLWQAPDEATRQVMVRFYGYLKKGLRKDEAMRQAKLAQLEACEATVANPFFWAGFVANGDMGALFEKK